VDDENRRGFNDSISSSQVEHTYAGVPGFYIPEPVGCEEEIYSSEDRSWIDASYVSDVHDAKREGFVQPDEPRADKFFRQEFLEQHRSRGEFFRWAADEKLQKKLVVIGSVRQARHVVKHIYATCSAVSNS
jgi:hypothetical protein